MKTKTKGSGLIFAVVLLFVILGMVITLASVTMLETKMNQKTKSSIGAFYNSESGVEWALNQIATKNGTAQISTLGSCPFTGCSVLFLGADGKVLAASATIDQVKAVRSTGNQNGETQRAIEAAVASAGGGCYVSYKDDATDAACITGFKNKGSAGGYGYCHDCGSYSTYSFMRPPNGTCGRGWCYDGDIGQAYVCCQN